MSIRDAIEGGQILMMVDVKPEQREKVENLVREHHPEATIEGVEPHAPLIPR